MVSYAPLTDRISAEAADWFARLQDSNEPKGLRAEFVEWLLRSPLHLEEFLAVARVCGDAELAEREVYSVEALIAAALVESAPDNVVSLPSPVQSASDRFSGPTNGVVAVGKSHRRYWLGAVAAVACVAVGALTWLAVRFDTSTIHTGIGEQRSITLADGSLVDINTNSEIRIDLERSVRRVRLVSGEARFQVAWDPSRPFIVSTPQATVRALGTAFNVYSQAERTEVAVLEGRVVVSELTQPAVQGAGKARMGALELQAGQQASVNVDGHILPNVGTPMVRIAAWRQHHLVFRDEPLAEVVAEFNRYHERPIRIEDSQLGALRISGTFESTDPNSLLAYLMHYENVQVEQRADGTYLRQR